MRLFGAEAVFAGRVGPICVGDIVLLAFDADINYWAWAASQFVYGQTGPVSVSICDGESGRVGPICVRDINLPAFGADIN